jgi:hypothetical protein
MDFPIAVVSLPVIGGGVGLAVLDRMCRGRKASE